MSDVEPLQENLNNEEALKFSLQKRKSRTSLCFLSPLSAHKQKRSRDTEAQMVYALPTTTVLVFSLISHHMLKGLPGYYFLVEDSYLLSPYYLLNYIYTAAF